MDAYYSAQNMTMRLKDIDRDQICVAVDASNYYRVQIKKISVDKVLKRTFVKFHLKKSLFKMLVYYKRSSAFS